MAIVAPVPGSVGNRLARLQRRIDSEGLNGLPPHIPLVGPFQARPSFLPLEQHCWQVCHGCSPFDVELEAPAVGEEQRLVVAEIASGNEGFLALREELLVGKYAPPRDQGPYHPRAVIARLRGEADVVVGEREVPLVDTELTFCLERIELMAQYPDGTWYQRDFYTLDGALTKA